MISVVIPSYRSPKYLDICLSSLFEGSPVLLSILTKLSPEGTLNGILFLLVLEF